jgi:hypothetical protein
LTGRTGTAGQAVEAIDTAYAVRAEEERNVRIL